MKYLITLVTFLSLLVACQDSKVKNPEQNKVKDTVQKNIAEQDTIAYPFLIGTYTRQEGHVNGQAKGIHVGLLYPNSGMIEIKGTYDAGINPSYLTISNNEKFVYAVNETGGSEEEKWGRITALQINQDLSLTQINSRSAKGIAPCHISMDNNGSSVLIANYVSGDVASFTTGLKGQLSGVQNIKSFKGKGEHPRQEAPHAHYIQQLENGLVITTDLGTDSLRLFEFNGIQLTNPTGGIILDKGSGPRHIAVHPNNMYLYVLNELNATIDFLEIKNKKLIRKSIVSTLPADNTKGDGHCAAIKLTQNGKFLYATNRGKHNNIAIYQLNELGQPILVGHQTTLGNTPREISISPDDNYLIAANQDSDNIALFKINQQTGLLEGGTSYKNIATPVCVDFLSPIQL